MGAGLQEIVRRKRQDLVKQKGRVPLAQLKGRLSKAPPTRDFAKAIRKKGRIALIAELKQASPSAGAIRGDYDVAAGAKAYAKGGASALSVLTEENYFLGRLEHLAEAKAAVKLPVLRKDFIIDPYQVVESRVHGADAVLLIVALLKQGELIKMLSMARKMKMTPLVEIHDLNELGRALDAEADVIGINSRNLKDLSMDPLAFRKLVPFVPPGSLVVAESGIRNLDDVKSLKRLKVNAMLVGESLLRQPDLTAAAKILVEAGKDK